MATRYRITIDIGFDTENEALAWIAGERPYDQKPKETNLNRALAAIDIAAPPSPFDLWLHTYFDVGLAAKGDSVCENYLHKLYHQWAEKHRASLKALSTRAFADALEQRQIRVVGKTEAGFNARGPLSPKP